ncbi:hypothetical protein [Paenibacillus medicaginis]|uniref:Uncharacterized protein n=1 Tax=Paenibacillus medicaginis TaxID=1470560 RepID=A0ABV5C7X5_9BACL
MAEDIFLSPKNLSKMRVAVDITVPTVPEAHVVTPLIFLTKNGGELAVMDKKLAHSLLEVMVIETSKREKRTINQLSAEENVLYVELLSLFITFINKKEIIEKYNLDGTAARIVFNYDPWTQDRDGLQPVKRFHTHLYIVNNQHIDQIETNSTTYGEIEDRYLRRRLVDPFSFLGASLLFDIHQNLLETTDVVAQVKEPNPEQMIENGLPIGLNVKIINESAALNREGLRKYIVKLNALIERSYNELYRAITGEASPAEKFKRHDILNKKDALENLSEISWLSERSLQGLEEAIVKLRSPSDRLFKRKHHLDMLIFHNILNGLAYTFSISLLIPSDCSRSDALDINISVRLFGDSGGAGMFGYGNKSAVMLQRGKGIYNSLELAERHSFQADLQKYLMEELSSKYAYRKMEAAQANSLLNQYYANKAKINSEISQEIILKIINHHRNK